MESKPWYASTGMWGNIFAFLGQIGVFVGISISPEVQAQAADAVSKLGDAIATKNWVVGISALGAVVGIAMSVIGRKQATQPVHFLAPSTGNGTAKPAP